jgi:signal transduction protein with GAF and PtsI domain
MTHDDAVRPVRTHATQPGPAALAESSLQEQAELARRLVGATSCSVMLLNSDTPEDQRMRLVASAGEVPAAAADALVARGEGICGRVLANGRALLVDDIARSEFAGMARRHRAAVPALMSAPVRIDGRTVGVLNATGAVFSEAELALFEVMALFIGKAVQVGQLQGLLASRFAQLALVREGELSAVAYQNPDDLARILARSFFKEMTRAGFEPGQIVSAATELIGQLNGSLQEGTQAGS